MIKFWLQLEKQDLALPFCNRSAERGEPCQKPLASDQQTNNQKPSLVRKEWADGAICAVTAHKENCVERLLVQPIAVPLDEIKDKAKTSGSDKIFDLLHQKNFNT